MLSFNARLAGIKTFPYFSADLEVLLSYAHSKYILPRGSFLLLCWLLYFNLELLLDIVFTPTTVYIRAVVPLQA